MTEQETRAIEQTIGEVKQAIIGLTSTVTELQLRISELENIKAALTRLLPADKRIEHLFD